MALSSIFAPFILGNGNLTRALEDAYHRALNIADGQFRRMQSDEGDALQEKHADAILRAYEQ
jgi:hypothetical protein